MKHEITALVEQHGGLLNTSAVADMIGCSHAQVFYKIHRGLIPKPVLYVHPDEERIPLWVRSQFKETV